MTARTGDSLQTYLREAKEEALLTAAEECALAEAIAQGDSAARTRMIQANLRLVVKIASEYSGRGVNLDDLIGEGNIGLLRAVEQFQPRFGTRFSTYACYWIKQSILRALLNTTSMIRLPAHMAGLMKKWRRAERSLARERGFAPSFNEVASFLGLSKTQSTLVFKAHKARHLTLESCVVAEAGRWSPVDTADPYPAPDTVLEQEDERRSMLERMAKLDGRERTILMLRYGLAEDEPLTLKEVGRRLGITREWVRKIETRAIQKLNGEEMEEPLPVSEEARLRRWRKSTMKRRRQAATASTSPSGQTGPPCASPGLYWLTGDAPPHEQLA